MAQTSSESAGAPAAVHAFLNRIEQAGVLDGPAERVATLVRGAVPAGPVKDLLSGTWLGHALHPVLTDVPIGTWTSATLLDIVGGRSAQPAVEKLLAVGILAALPTAASGMTDWADSTVGDPASRRVGSVHAVANSAALALYTASLVARRRGRKHRGVMLALAGGGALGLGGMLGGHLSYARGLGVDQTVFETRPSSWIPAESDGALAEGAARVVEVEGVEIMITRQVGQVFALADRCCHRGGPLHEGSFDDGCVTCPWHQSRFRLSDGAIVQGPATYPQPGYDVRVSEGTIEVRARA